MTKILILGSEGFLGSVLTPYLLKNNRHLKLLVLINVFLEKIIKILKILSFIKKIITS